MNEPKKHYEPPTVRDVPAEELWNEPWPDLESSNPSAAGEEIANLRAELTAQKAAHGVTKALLAEALKQRDAARGVEPVDGVRCGCGTKRTLEDLSAGISGFYVAGVPNRLSQPSPMGSRYGLPPAVRACRGCGAIYVVALAMLADPPSTEEP